jgi:hypothetical protein
MERRAIALSPEVPYVIFEKTKKFISRGPEASSWLCAKKDPRIKQTMLGHK